MEFDAQVKLAVYRHFAETGKRPTVDAVAARVGAGRDGVLASYQRLRAQRLLSLEADGASIRMAPPFSGVPTQHIVECDGIRYFANCAWDALGILAALHKAGTVHSRCGQSGEPLELPVGLQGPPPSDWIFHCLVPAAKWWDDIVFTWRNMLFFRSEERVREWCVANGAPMRPLVTMDQLWRLATTWYSTRLLENSRRPAPAEMRGIFAGLGLEGDFWDPSSDSFG